MSLEKDEKLILQIERPIVVAVSGGVDSAVLLHLVAKLRDADEIIVAHVDHGIRKQSPADARFVKALSACYGIKYESTKLKLGPNSSEETARVARYDWLQNVVAKKYEAKSILTAHHQDDLLETMVINIIRGSKRLGLISLADRDSIKRPLLGITKAELYDYAAANKLEWVEDQTNTDTRYLRNKVRLLLLPKLKKANPDAVKKLLSINKKLKQSSPEIDSQLEQLLKTLLTNNKISRAKFIELTPNVRLEFIVKLMRKNKVNMANLGTKDFKKIEHFICTAKPAAQLSPIKGVMLKATKTEIVVSF